MLIKDKIALVPTDPGCYLMKNSQDEIIYVGKAKNLRNRIKSYFSGAHNYKTTKLVSEITDFMFVVTNSEQESLILELNLIKQHKPKYNIDLMDDKTYPYIQISDETPPSLKVVRSKHVKGKVFGPYPNVKSANETARFLNKMFPMGKKDPIPNFFEALGDRIVPNQDIKKSIDVITRFLKGDIKEIKDVLIYAMEEASEQMAFEKAVVFRDTINYMTETTEKQIVSINDYKDRDIIGFAYNNDEIALQILFMRKGKIVDQYQLIFDYVDDPIQTLLLYLKRYYESNQPDEILFSKQLDEEVLNTYFGTEALIPKIGDKKKLVDLATKNASFDLEHHNMLYKHKTERILKAHEELKSLIGTSVNRIDCFDNSQLFGTSPISAMIVYQDNVFDKKEYRKYHLKTTINDDYQAMKEVVYRRYYKMLLENLEKPDLILIDGGKGQVGAAQEVLNTLDIDIPVAGLKKNKKHQLEALVYHDDTHVLNTHSELYKLLLSISEEVHRFAISFHRGTRKKQTEHSVFDQVKGLGKVRKKALLKTFKSLDAIREASLEELMQVGIPKEVALKIKELI